MQDFLLPLSTLDLPPDYGIMFHASWENRDPDLLAAGVNIAILHQGGNHSSCHDSEDLPLDVQQGYVPELSDGLGVLFLRDEDCHCSLPL